VLVLPDTTKVEIRDWSAYAPAVAEGYRAMLAALDKLERPVQELRRRASLQDEESAVTARAASAG
jgi:NTE family protein